MLNDATLRAGGKHLLSRIVLSIRDFLPRGEGLSEAVWTKRHKAFRLILWLHVIGLPLLGWMWERAPLESLSAGLIIGTFALLAGVDKFNRRVRAALVSLGFASASGLLVHLSGGYIEMHFHYFVVVTFLTLYQDWVPFLVCILFVGLQHGLIGFGLPIRVYNHPDALAHPWKWAAIHALFIGGASIGCLVAWRNIERGVKALRQAHEELEHRIEERTAELRRAVALLQEKIIERKRAEEALRWSEERFRLIMNNAHDAIFYVDLTGVIQWTSHQAVVISGRSMEEMVGRSFMTVLTPEAAARAEARLAAIRRGESVPPLVEFEVLHPDGSVVWVEANITSVLEDGKVVGRLLVARDISERKEAEEALHANVARMLQQESALIALTRRETLQDEDLMASLRRTTEVSAKTLSVARVSVWRYNLDRTAIRCVDLYELHEDRHSSGVELTAAAYPSYFQALAESDVIPADNAHADARTREFSDDYLTPRGITSMMDAPVRLHGVLDGVVCHEHIGSKRQWTLDERTFAIAIANLVSLTLEEWERKRAEEALRESEKQMRLFTLATNDSTWNWDMAACSVTRSSFERAFGYSVEEVVPSIGWWEERLHPDDRERVLSTFRDAVARGSVTCSYEYRFRRRDGSYAVISDRAYIVRDGTGKPVRTLGAMTDITERKEAHEALHKSGQRLNQLLEDRERISRDLHDNIIQTLYAIGMGLEECQRLIKKDSARAFRMAGGAVTGLNAVIRDVRKYIAGLEPQILSGQQLRAELAELVRTVEAPHLLRFRLSVDPLAAARLTPEEASHVLYIAREAMSNSLRHSGARSGLVSLQTQDGHVRLQLEDDGVGFDPLAAQGRGEGLRNMAARVKKLGGTLEIVSERRQGVRIVVDIPKESGHASA